MSATVANSVPDATVEMSIGPSAAEALDEICRGMGLVPLTAEEAASLPPWADEEADAFERTINETFEQIEETPKLS